MSNKNNRYRPFEHVHGATVNDLIDELEAARQRIVDLESREDVKLSQLERAFSNGKKAGRDEAMKEMSEREPVAHMYPSDLLRFESEETFAHAFSVAVGSPGEESVPLIHRPTYIPLIKDAPSEGRAA